MFCEFGKPKTLALGFYRKALDMSALFKRINLLNKFIFYFDPFITKELERIQMIFVIVQRK